MARHQAAGSSVRLQGGRLSMMINESLSGSGGTKDVCHHPITVTSRDWPERQADCPHVSVVTGGTFAVLDSGCERTFDLSHD